MKITEVLREWFLVLLEGLGCLSVLICGPHMKNFVTLCVQRAIHFFFFFKFCVFTRVAFLQFLTADSNRFDLETSSYISISEDFIILPLIVMFSHKRITNLPMTLDQLNKVWITPHPPDHTPHEHGSQTASFGQVHYT